MNEYRPEIKLRLTIRDKLLEFTGVVLLIALWIWVWTSYKDLPNEIPTHYNFKGEADNFGGKATIFLLPAIATFLFVVMSIVNRYPHYFNYLTKITEDNALHQYTIATQMIRTLKTVIVWIFGILAYKTIRYDGSDSGFGAWTLMILLGSVFITLIWFTYLLVRNKK